MFYTSGRLGGGLFITAVIIPFSSSFTFELIRSLPVNHNPCLNALGVPPHGMSVLTVPLPWPGCVPPLSKLVLAKDFLPLAQPRSSLDFQSGRPRALRRLNRDDFRCGNAIPVTLRAGMIHFVAIFYVQFPHGLDVFYFPSTLSWQAPLPLQADESPNPRPASTLNDV